MKTLLKVLVAIFALGLSASAAYFSVLGLTKMFAGAVLGTAIVCSFIEGSKLVIASVLHQFSKSLNWAIKGLLTVFLFLAMGITSMGVYGYLTNAFQSTANQLEVAEGQTKVLQLKRDRYQESLDAYVVEKKDLAQSVTNLTEALSNNVIEYKDPETGEIIRTTSSSARRTYERQLEDAKVQRDKISLKIESLTDSVTTIDLRILDINSNEELAAEIGPLKFITQLTGLEMNTVVNFLTLIIVLIIDPLAIVLVVVFNNIGKDEFKIEMSVPEGKEFNTPYPIPSNSEWQTKEDLVDVVEHQEDPNEEEWDEDHALDMVLNDMVNDLTEEDIEQIQEEVKKETKPNEALTEAAKRYQELMEEGDAKYEPKDDTNPEEFYGQKKRSRRVG